MSTSERIMVAVFSSAAVWSALMALAPEASSLRVAHLRDAWAFVASVCTGMGVAVVLL